MCTATPLSFDSLVGMSPSGAFFSELRTHRYTLWRNWETVFIDHPRQLVAFIGLNPSTADENLDDPTIRRCIGFAKQWGYSGFVMLNLFAYRATDPRVMKRHPDPVGELNDSVIEVVVEAVGKTVCAWGVHGIHRGRECDVKRLLSRCSAPVHHLGLTRGGSPKHPLYLPGDTMSQAWSLSSESLRHG